MVLSWLPVAAKVQMASVTDFSKLVSGFEVLQFLVISPLAALAWRDRVGKA
jgi:hypothetical protein